MTKDRSLIESKYKWKIDEMYNSKGSINNDIKKVEELISKVNGNYVGAGFYSAWKYVPFLLMATLFGGLSGFLGSFFSAAKNTKIFAISTCIGAIINIILNVFIIN